MATLNKQLMIDTIRTNNVWLHAAINRIATMNADNTLGFNLTDEQQYDLKYWHGWVKADKQLSGTHRDSAIKLMTESKCADVLWDYAVNHTATKEASK